MQRLQVKKAISNYIESRKSCVLGSLYTAKLDSILRYHRHTLVPEATEHYTINATDKQVHVTIGDETFTYKL